jgi:hypothetical protein
MKNVFPPDFTFLRAFFACALAGHPRDHLKGPSLPVGARMAHPPGVARSPIWQRVYFGAARLRDDFDERQRRRLLRWGQQRRRKRWPEQRRHSVRFCALSWTAFRRLQGAAAAGEK